MKPKLFLSLLILGLPPLTAISRADDWPQWPPPAYANRHVFARNDKELVCASLAAEP